MAIHVELKRPDALSPAERRAWMAIQGEEPGLASPYFALGFCDAVAAVRGDVRVVVQSQDGAPQAFLPLQVGGFGHARPLAGPLGDHHGVIARPHAKLDIDAMLSAAGVPVFDFFGFVPHRGAAAGHAVVKDGSWVIDLEGGFDAFKARRKKPGGNTFRTIFASNRKLIESGHVVEFCFADPSRDAIEQLFSWKSAQYRTTGHFDVFSRAWTRGLIRQLCAADGSAGVRGVLSSLKIDGEFAAVHFGMMSARAMHYWFPAYNPSLAKSAPGNALLEHLLKALGGQGVDEVHLGPGNYRYKAALGSWQIPLAQGFVALDGPAATLRRAAYALEIGASKLPLGPLSHWPGKAFRRIDRMDGFKAA